MSVAVLITLSNYILKDVDVLRAKNAILCLGLT